MRYPRLTRLSAIAILAFFAAACSDETPLDPQGPEPPARDISDAVHGDGNPFVLLKPPVVEQPSSDLFGTFNDDLRPVIEVCRLQADGCTVLTTNDGSDTAARYTMDGGPGGETVTVDGTAEEYQVQIHFKLFDLMEETTYRIITRVGDRVLAYADLILMSPSQMKNAESGTSISFTNDNKTVPWKVRIDDGALCWEEGESRSEVSACESGTVLAGDPETISLTSSDGEEVDFHLPDGWAADVEGTTVDELTVSIEELPTGDGTRCFQSLTLNDPETGEPSNCYRVVASTASETDVAVEFSGDYIPIIAFCPEPEVLQAIANGAEDYVMTSVEEDAQGAERRLYQNVAPPADFGGCPLPTSTAAAESIIEKLAAGIWDGIRPVMEPLLPRPLHAVDIGFGGGIRTLSTIFFWSRTPTDIAVTPSSAAMASGTTVQLTAEPIYHVGGAGGGGLAVHWSTSDANVASVATNGLVTAEGAGTAVVAATDSSILDPLGAPLRDSAVITVTTNVLGGFGTATIDGTTGAGEWDNAGCFTVNVLLPEGEADPNGEFCVMNDTDSLYVRSTYTNFADAADSASAVLVELDTDGDTEVSTDAGNDFYALRQVWGETPSFEDNYFYEASTFSNRGCPADTCSAGDPVLGGAIDGSGAYGNDGGVITFEVAHPLDSGDVGEDAVSLDAALAPGDVIYIRFAQAVYSDTQLNNPEYTNRVKQVNIIPSPIE